MYGVGHVKGLSEVPEIPRGLHQVPDRCQTAADMSPGSLREVTAPGAPVGVSCFAQRGLATKKEVDDFLIEGLPKKLTNDKEEFLWERVK